MSNQQLRSVVFRKGFTKPRQGRIPQLFGTALHGQVREAVALAKEAADGEEKEVMYSSVMERFAGMTIQKVKTKMESSPKPLTRKMGLMRKLNRHPTSRTLCLRDGKYTNPSKKILRAH